VELLPACGQGALAVQCRRSDAKTQARLAQLDHYLTRQAVLAERALNFRLGGSCQTPIAGYAQVSEGLLEQLILTAMVGSLDGKTVLRASAQGAISEPTALAESVAAMLLAQGAQALLRSDAAR